MPSRYPISDDTSRMIARNAVLSAPDGEVVTFTRKIILANEDVRGRALGLVGALKSGWVASIAKRNRTREQNDKMWAMLTDISRQKPEGREHTSEVWKALVMHACGHDCQFMQGLNGEHFPIGFRSSQLKIGQMCDLMDWMYSYGNDHGVKWSEPQDERNVA